MTRVLILAIVASGLIVVANPAVSTPTATNKAAWKHRHPSANPHPRSLAPLHALNC